MELNLKCIPIRDTSVCARLTMTAEESGDIVVPDSLPDIVRIVETDAHMELRSRELRGGKLYAEAAATVSVIYVPETGSGLCRLAVTLPLSAVFELEDLAESAVQTVVRTELLSATARELNPRKISVRAAGHFFCTAYAARETLLRVDAENDTVETKIETRHIRLTEGIYEKTLSVSDSVELASALPGEPEILKYETSVRTTDLKQIKNKVVLKGEIDVSMLLLSNEEGNAVCSAQTTVPFAGVVDCVGVDEDTAVDFSYEIGSCDLKIVRESGTNRPLLTAKLELLTVIEAWSETDVSYIADAYGVAQPIACEAEELTFCRAGRAVELRRSGRETINCGVTIKQIYMCGIAAENAAVRSGENGCEALADCRIRLILEAEDGGIYALTKALPLSVPVEDGTLTIGSAEITDKSYHISGNEEIEVRFSLVLRLVPDGCETISQIRRMDRSPVSEPNQRRPALTLCYAANGESLWQLGKRLGARISDIRAANALSGDILPDGKLLLIPRTAKTEGRI